MKKQILFDKVPANDIHGFLEAKAFPLGEFYIHQVCNPLLHKSSEVPSHTSHSDFRACSRIKLNSFQNVFLVLFVPWTYTLQ